MIQATPDLTPLPLPALDDNYIWALARDGLAVVVDPAEAGPVRRWLEANRLRLAAILVTHHHGDHVDGNAELHALSQCRVIGPDRPDAIPALNEPVRGGQRVALPELGLDFEVLDLGGHTRDHLGYLGAGMLFCGDTLFSCGCGRLFEGSHAQMTASLERILALPDDTLVCSAHEYTLEGIRFSRTVEPDNPRRDAWEAEARTLRAAGRPTLPTTVGLERQVNPFLRFREPALRTFAQSWLDHPPASDVETFGALRDARDAWRDRPDA